MLSCGWPKLVNPGGEEAPSYFVIMKEELGACSETLTLPSPTTAWRKASSCLSGFNMQQAGCGLACPWDPDTVGQLLAENTLSLHNMMVFI